MIGESDDMGISLGRNLALKMVKTKYFLLVDDDHVFNDKTNLDKVNQSDSIMKGISFLVSAKYLKIYLHSLAFLVRSNQVNQARQTTSVTFS